MSDNIYHENNYRLNLTTYWKQFFPEWEIPKGYHVHHIVPRSVGKQNGWSDYKINHPNNLIALHPEDHVSIHKCRGDKYLSKGFLKILGNSGFGENNSMYGKTHSKETKMKMSKSRTGDKNGMYGKTHSKESRDKISEFRQQHVGWNHNDETINKMSDSAKSIGAYMKENNKSRTNGFGYDITIDGVYYKSIKDAIAATGISRHKLMKIRDLN